MARKETITAEDIRNAAFCMAREEGISSVTARRLAARAGCSTQPIFKAYKNMEELETDLYELVILFFDEFYDKFPKTDTFAFVNLGMAYIAFAEEEKNLFQLLFLSETRGGRSMYELLNGKNGSVGKEIKIAKQDGCKAPEDLFMKMWIFIHGAACMTITGDYDLNRGQTEKLLCDMYQALA